MTRFVNTANGYSEVVRWQACFLWSLLFGSIFFLFKGVYKHAALAFILAICTLGISHFIYPFFAAGILKRDYLQRGWVQVSPSMGYTRRQGAGYQHRLPSRGSNVPRDAYGRISGVSYFSQGIYR